MSLSLAKNQHMIKNGDLIAFKGNRFLDQIIRLFTRSTYSHVGMAIWRNNVLCVIEATWPRVVINPLVGRTDFYHIDMNIEWKPEYDTLLDSRVGAKYSIWHDIQAMFVKPNQDGEWECAMLDTIDYNLMGVPLNNLYTPDALVQACAEYSPDGINLFVK
jgi:hypothetical protein